MKTQNILLVIIIFILAKTEAQTVVKANLLTALVAVPHIGIETKIGAKTTFQIDAIASFWKSFNGGPQQFLIVIPEFRYHTKEAFKGFYVGAHIGGGAFKLQKWNYINTDRYQEGYNILIGGTIGYQFKINEKFNAEMFVGGGSQQAFYKGYLLSSGERYDGADNYNKSGELIPYRIGLMLIYKIK